MNENPKPKTDAESVVRVRVRPGAKWVRFEDSRRYGPGDEFELPANEAAHWLREKVVVLVEDEPFSRDDFEKSPERFLPSEPGEPPGV